MSNCWHFSLGYAYGNTLINKYKKEHFSYLTQRQKIVSETERQQAWGVLYKQQIASFNLMLEFYAFDPYAVNQQNKATTLKDGSLATA